MSWALWSPSTRAPGKKQPRWYHNRIPEAPAEYRGGSFVLLVLLGCGVCFACFVYLSCRLLACCLRFCLLLACVRARLLAFLLAG